MGKGGFGKVQGGKPQGGKPQGAKPQGDKPQGGKPQGGKSQARQLVNGPRQLGSVVEWKGAFGWIVPSKPISHPKARPNGKVYLAQEDVTEELEGVGAKVSFQLYADGQGLGAQDCKMAKAAAPSAPIPAKGGGKGKSKPAAKAHPSAGKFAAKPAAPQVAPTWSKTSVQQPAFQKKPQVAGGVQKGGAAQKGNAALDRFGRPIVQTPQQKGAGGAAQNLVKGGAAQNFAKGAAAKGAGKGKEAKGSEDKGPAPRQIIYNKPLKGIVKEWKGKFGWVKPFDTIDHPLAQKHNGDLFLAQQDVEQEINGVGSTVRFMLYEDTRGLGAANVRPA